MRLYLIRHPRPLAAAGLCYGRLDVAAEDPGPVAASLRPRLPAAIPVWTSPLTRCLRLATALHPAPRIEPRLREMDFGAWEGLAWDAIGAAALDAWAADLLHHVPPGGESAAAMQARAVAAIAEIAATGDPAVAVVAHAGVIRAVVGHWQRLPIGEWSRLPCDFGSVTEIEVGVGGLDDPR